jgi:hypothetical protein
MCCYYWTVDKCTINFYNDTIVLPYEKTSTERMNYFAFMYYFSEPWTNTVRSILPENKKKIQFKMRRNIPIMESYIGDACYIGRCFLKVQVLNRCFMLPTVCVDVSYSLYFQISLTSWQGLIKSLCVISVEKSSTYISLPLSFWMLLLML